MLLTHKNILYSISCILICGGFLYYAWQQEWIIFRHPSYAQKPLLHQNYTKKTVTLYLWNNKWLTEQAEIIWSSSDAQNAHNLTRALCNTLHEEQLIKKKLYIEGAFIDPSHQELFLLFDRPPFSKNMSIYQKTMLIESILKSLRENGITIPRIRLLVNNKPMLDFHLDFSQGWPLEGYLPK